MGKSATRNLISIPSVAFHLTPWQKRHVIGHNLGIADAAFAEHASDARLGETVPLVGEDILQFAQIGQMVINHVDAWLASGHSPPSEVRLDKPLTPMPPSTPATLQIGQLGPLAVQIGCWIAEQSQTGFGDFMSEGALTQAFPDATLDDLGFAVAELAKDGFFLSGPARFHAPAGAAGCKPAGRHCQVTQIVWVPQFRCPLVAPWQESVT